MMVMRNFVNRLRNFTTFCCGEVCEGCLHRKANRLLFNQSLSGCNAALELIHNDVVVSKISLSFSFFYMLFVDDFTKFTWVCFVKEKLDVFSKFKAFKMIVEDVLEKKNKMLRTDNGGEFTLGEFFLFCQKHGIKRVLTCVDT